MSDQNGPELMNLDKAYEADLGIFRDLISHGDPQDPASIMKGWDYYKAFTATRAEKRRRLDEPHPEMSSEVFIDGLASEFVKSLHSEPSKLSPTLVSTLKTLFLGDTTGVVGGEVGVTIRGLSGTEFENSKLFTQEMYKLDTK